MKSGTRSRLVSVVIPVRNGGATIGEQLVALRDQASDCDEIVVVDNGSVDDTRAVVESFRDQIPNLRLVDGEGLVGVSSVRNHAAAHTVGDLLWCDADDVVAPGWVTAMIEGLDEHDIVGGAMEEYSLNGPCAIPRTGHAHGLACAWDFLPYAIGANVAVRREVIEGVGGWNPGTRVPEKTSTSAGGRSSPVSGSDSHQTPWSTTDTGAPHAPYECSRSATHEPLRCSTASIAHTGSDEGRSWTQDECGARSCCSRPPRS